MSTTLNDLGIVFPDSTVQTSAASPPSITYIDTTPDATTITLGSLPSTATKFTLSVAAMGTSAPVSRYPVVRPYSSSGLLTVSTNSITKPGGQSSSLSSVSYKFNNTTGNLTFTDSTSTAYGYQLYIRLAGVSGSTYKYVSYFVGGIYGASTYAPAHIIGFSTFSSNEPITSLEVGLTASTSSISFITLNQNCQLTLEVS